MSRSLSYLRRGLLGIAFVGSMGFGVTQAWGSPNPLERGPITVATCEDLGYDYPDAFCNFGYCGSQGGGYCSAGGYCRCGIIP